MTTIAGTGIMGYSEDNILATSAALEYTTGVAIDASSNSILIGDGRRLRKIIKATGKTVFILKICHYISANMIIVIKYVILYCVK